MAFNPFTGFRKFGKVIMAGLAILCMFLFVLSSGLGGGGDALDWIAGRVGARGASATAATINGSRLSDRELARLFERRRLANAYMAIAAAESQRQVIDQLAAELEKFPAEQRGPLSQAVNAKKQFDLVRDPQFAMFAAFQYMQKLPQISAGVQGVLRQLEESNSTEAELKKARANLLNRVLLLLEQDGRRIGKAFQGRSDDELYFGGTLNNESLIDFALWLKQADRLGVHYTPADTANLFNAETLTVLTGEALKTVGDAIRDMPGARSGTLTDALADEFRARAAQASLAGGYVFDREHTPRVATAPPTAVTPHDFYDYYRDVRTTLQVGLVPVDANAFLAKVTEKPAEGELKKLFDKYANVEPNPFSPTPGFKEPRKVRVQWLTGSAESPFYQKGAVTVAKAMKAVGALSGPGGFGGGFVAPAVTVAGPVAFDAALLAEYGRYRAQADRARSWTSAFLIGPSDLYERAFVHPETVAGVLGQILGDAGTRSGGLPAALGAFNQALVRDLRERGRVGGTSVLTALGGPPFAALGLPVAAPPQPLPFDAVRGMLLEKSSAELSRQLFAADLKQFRTDLAKKSAEARDAKAREALMTFVKEFVTSRGLESAETTQPLGRWEIGDAPALAPLKAEYEKRSGTGDPQGRGFGRTFIPDQGQGATGTAGLYKPEWFPAEPFPGDAGPNWLVWRVEDKDPRKPTFAEAEARVLEAWKLDKARDLAKKEADALAKRAADAKGDRRKLIDLAYADAKASLIELGPMAKLMPGPHHDVPNLSGLPEDRVPPRDYQPYQLPAEKVPEVLPDFGDKLLDLRKGEPGKTEVLPNAAKTVFYVASLISKDVPDQAAFRQTYRRSGPGVTGRDQLLERYQARQTEAFRLSVLGQLRQDSKLVVEAWVRDKARNRDDQ